MLKLFYSMLLKINLKINCNLLYLFASLNKTVKLFSFLLCLVLLYSCSSDDDLVCSINSNNIFVKLVDNEGNNLIENETYLADEIVVRFNAAYEFTNVVFNEVEGLENLIAINIFGEQGNNTFEIQLSDSETDTLILNLNKEIIDGPCGNVYYILNSVTYNGNDEIPEDFDGDYLITVTK